MRQISTREKIFLGMGAVTALVIFVYFILWPMLQGDQSSSTSSLEELQARLESVKKLENMAPTLVSLEKRLRGQSGYGEMSFKRGIAGSTIFSYLAKAAAQADIKNLEQLDPKPYKGKKSESEVISEQAIFKSIVDQMHLEQVAREMEQGYNSANESKTVNNPPSEMPPEPDESDEDKNVESDRQDGFNFGNDQVPPPIREFLEERGVSIEELEQNPELSEKLRKEFEAKFQNSGDDPPPAIRKFLEERGVSIEELKQDPELSEKIRKEFEASMENAGNDSPMDRPEISKIEEPAKPDVSEAPEASETDENMEQAEKGELLFPPIPKDIPSEVKSSLAKFMTEHPGNTIALSDINWILDEAGIEDEKEGDRIRKRLKLYSSRVVEVKNEIRQWLGNLSMLKNDKSGNKIDKFTVKMVFKSQMDQLVKLLYNLQEHAKWLKLESMRVSVSDRKQTLLSVELSMTATTLYDL